MPRHRALLACAASLLALALGSAASAQPLDPDDIPPDLREWKRWVTRDLAGHACPLIAGSTDRRSAPCLWPASLQLAVDARGATFSLSVRAFEPSSLTLPGDAAHPPLDVTLDGKPTAVLGQPRAVRLTTGDHTLAGRFAWNGLPESIALPAAIGLVTLTIDGKPVEFPVRDTNGLLRLRKNDGAAEAESTLELKVARRLDDEVPALLTVHVTIDASGKGREVVLAKPLGHGWIPLALRSPVPARLDPDGRLRVQLRPGRWELELEARSTGPVTTLSFDTPNGPWVDEEVWVFDARPSLRVVVPEGLAAIDPSQVPLPGEWKEFPAFRARPGESLSFREERRGDADPRPDRLALQRRIWLDFDGGGATFSDRITGSLSRSWRLDMQPALQLGRVAVGGQDQLVTRGPGGSAGVEVRDGNLVLEADSRFEGGISSLPAVGWDTDFQRVGGRLELPPGFRALWAGGVDSASGTWVRRWTLLDLFLVLVTAIAVARLFGRVTGVVALAALGLGFPENGYPESLWLAPVVTEALVRVIPHGRAADLLRLARLASLVALVVVLVPFSVIHLRIGLFPVLERPYADLAGGAPAFEPAPDDDDGTSGGRPRSRSAFAAQDSANIVGGEELAWEQAPQQQVQKKLSRSFASSGYENRLDYKQVDPKASVQTGFGQPEWSWNAIQLTWNGPVQRTQRLELVLLGPGLNLLLAFLRVALTALLLLALFRGRQGPPLASQPVRSIPEAAPLAAALALLVPMQARADIPTPELLNELRDALAKPPECGTECVALHKLALDATPTTLRIRLEFGLGAHVAVPLPGAPDQWSPATVLVDGSPAKGLRRDPEGTLRVELRPGVHQVQLEGPLPKRDSVQLPLPSKPALVSSTVTGWVLDGVSEEGAADDNLQLTRVKSGEGDVSTLEEAVLPPFVAIERSVLLGLDWKVETTVRRQGAPGVPVVLEVPLLDGEQVTTEAVRVVDGKALVSMGPRVDELKWFGTLPPRDGFTLTASSQTAWTEVWRLEATPTWHVETKGIPPIHADPAGGVRVPEWRPWPGETLALSITRPEPVEGRTLTVLASHLSVRPGLRTSESTLVVTLTTSRGQRHVVTLPEGAVLQSVSMDDREVPARLEGRDLALTLVPGRHTASVKWLENKGISAILATPQVDLHAPSVNARTSVELSGGRWLLFAWGPRTGPAILFWSLLLVLCLVAAGLSRVDVTPLKLHEWLLLAIGLSQVEVVVAALVPALLLGLGFRARGHERIPGVRRHNLLQVAFVVLALAAASVLLAAIQRGLLGTPEMQVQGNGSTARVLAWFTDRSGPSLPVAHLLSVPLLAYRLAMLAWALWLAASVVRWSKWAWGAFAAGGAWRRAPAKVQGKS